MIKGIGTDICDLARIRHLVERFPQKFARRILTPVEYEKWLTKADKAAWLGARFAAKEAIVKALGTGFRYGLSFQDFTIVNTKDGAPLVKFSQKAQKFLKKGRVHLSLSDEKGYAIAFCVVEDTIS